MRRFAARLGLVDENGRPKQDNVRLTTVHGVVARASEKVPLMRLNYELQGMLCQPSAGLDSSELLLHLLHGYDMGLVVALSLRMPLHMYSAL